MGGSYNRSRVCYLRENVTDRQNLKFVKRDSFAPWWFMVWALVSFYSKPSLKNINKGVKVNAGYSVKIQNFFL
jgi:hypothetical protein